MQANKRGRFKPSREWVDAAQGRINIGEPISSGGRTLSCPVKLGGWSRFGDDNGKIVT